MSRLGDDTSLGQQPTINAKIQYMGPPQYSLLSADVPVNLGGNEPHIAVSPADPNTIAISGCSSVSLSFDGGQHFVKPPVGNYGAAVCDQAVAFDSTGRLFVSFVVNGVPQQKNVQTDMFMQQIDARPPGSATASRLLDTGGAECPSPPNSSPDCPINISASKDVGSPACPVDPADGHPTGPGHTADRDWITIDTRPACGTPIPSRSTRTCSPFTDRIYVTWADTICGSPNNNRDEVLRIASSADQGRTWQTGALPAPPTSSQGYVTVAANGDVYAAVHGFTDNTVSVARIVDGDASHIGDMSVPFKPPVDVAMGNNDQQCSCGGQVFCGGPLASPQVPCTLDAHHCPGPYVPPGTGVGCECQANNCAPDPNCPNTPINGWMACPGRLETNGAFTVGSMTPYVVADPTNPDNIAVFSNTRRNDPGTPDDHFDVQYVISTNATASGPTHWSGVTPVGSILPGSNQMFPAAVSGSNGSCVSLAYYDDRNPLLNSVPHHLLDVYVTVNPNIWAAGSAWQPEKTINHVSFDPDLDGDNSSYCQGVGGCNEPTGWRKQIRIGEYFGLLQAAGVAWTGRDANGQAIFFDYSDVIPPVVVAPPATTVATCKPTMAMLGTPTATDPCGLPKLSAPTFSPQVLSRGSNTVTFSISDGAGNVGKADQRVTVNDTTPPSIDITSTEFVTICNPGATAITIGTPNASDDCGGQVTVTGKVIRKNGVTLTTPINVVNGQVTLGAGVYVIQWTASDGINTSTPVLQTVTVEGKIQAANTFTLDDNSYVKDTNGSAGQIFNSGSGQTLLGVSATSGSITSVGSVQLSNKSKVTGNIVSAGGISVPPTATVTGTQTPHTSVVLPALPQLPTFPPPVGNDIYVNGTRFLTPGSYPNVYLNSNSTLNMAAGDFYFQSFYINSTVNVKVQVTPNTRVFVQNQFAFRSPFTNSSGAVQPVLLGFAGSNLVVETSFKGTLIAPNGSVTFGLGSAITYQGAFYAKSIEVRNNATLLCDEALTPPLPTNPPPTTCSDATKDGTETDVDCGGGVCAPCPNGKHCLVGSDCQNGSCVSGLCQQPTGPVNAALQVTSDWGTGYCANLLVSNFSTAPTQNWTVVINTKQSTTYTTWNGNFSGTTGSITVTPGFAWNQVIAPGATNNTVGFCANRTPANSGALPIVVSASGTF